MKFPNIGVWELLKSLIQNNTGHSSKTAAYLLGVTTGCLCVLLITLYLGYDILRLEWHIRRLGAKGMRIGAGTRGTDLKIQILIRTYN